ncbi:hypothetical protein MHZ92_07790 [Sporosarcina sp. ACRSL]|uniref:hypothetical protein n=1 Tax=Sporosarcina sp. ACRSL TaxID=2918215 RepID=UPI001EF52EF2|nr:hypothetical protein [Sporosarcina sp. ACRSL]MCG7344029.1 hypothetical protein [Sporosarcina sp. ACRSL]
MANQMYYQLNSSGNATENYFKGSLGEANDSLKSKTYLVETSSFLKENTLSEDQVSRKELLEKASIQSRKEAERFTNMLKNDFIEVGFFSSSEIYLLTKLKKEPIETKDWLNKVLLDNLDQPSIIVKLLHIIADIDYEMISPQGPVLALAATRIPDDEVQEYSIRAFEKWGTQECLKVLKNTRYQEGWLQDYANEVIEDLEEEFS